LREYANELSANRQRHIRPCLIPIVIAAYCKFVYHRFSILSLLFKMLDRFGH
jgi:hypothetical protein